LEHTNCLPPLSRRRIRIILLFAAIFMAMVAGVFVGSGSRPSAFLGSNRERFFGKSPVHPADDPALLAMLPEPSATANLPPSPLNDLLKPGLTPEQQTDVIGQMLLDYWTNLHTLPAGTWEETCAKLAGGNKKHLEFVPKGHPAVSGDAFRTSAKSPGIRLHVISSSGGVFQLIYDGPDGLPYTDDDLVRNFPPELDKK